MKFAAVMSICGALVTSGGFADEARVVERPGVSRANSHYVGNREPLAKSPLIKLPVGAIEPRGWLRKQLELQAAGFHGHLSEISRFLDKKNNAWLDAKGKGASGWEEVPYWLKGFADTGYVLHDKRIIDEAKTWIEATFKSQQPDGWFGPGEERTGLATGLKGRTDLWPNMVMLFCLQSYHEYTGDRRVIDLMTKYADYLLRIPVEKLLRPIDWQTHRGGDLLYSVLWLYNRTGDARLLELARSVHRQTSPWERELASWHNVNIAQGFREPGIFAIVSKNPADLAAADRNWRRIRELYGQVPGGMFGSDENCREGYTGPRQAIETCGMVEEMLSDELLLAASGDLVWADRCEDVAFNSLPAATTADLKALRYLTSPNMVLSDRRSKSPGLQNGGPMLHMDPHNHRCCQHNFGHGWPYFAQHLWMATPDGGLAAVMYAASKVTAKVGDGATVSIEQRTNYPFDEQVELVVRAEKPVRFPLYLRVPGWCQSASVKVNGQANDSQPQPLKYIHIDRQWKDGDRVTLSLSMTISVRTWAKNDNSISVDRGPLTYSLKIGEKYVRAGGTDKWPAWEIHPTTPWNYGLVLDATSPASSFEVVKSSFPANDMPFTHEGNSIEILATGRRIPQWQMDHLGLVGNLQPSPVRSDEPNARIRLIPMGAARLRISAFPVIGDGPDAHIWKEPPRPKYKATASHCFGNDTETAMCDGVLPKSSSDQSIPRFTWWDKRGTTECVEYDFEKPRKVSSVEVYWFDDAPRGGCRVPKSWRVLYRDGEAWKPVSTSGTPSVEKDKFNQLDFDAVTTSRLRIEAELQGRHSGGILEWRVE